MADELREVMAELAKSQIETNKAMKGMFEGQKEMREAIKDMAGVMAGLGVFVNGLHDGQTKSEKSEG